jgi:hypothetical protein
LEGVGKLVLQPVPEQVQGKKVEPVVGTEVVPEVGLEIILPRNFRRMPNRRYYHDRRLGRKALRLLKKEPCKLGLPGFELLDRLCEDHIHNDRKTSLQEEQVCCS